MKHQSSVLFGDQFNVQAWSKPASFEFIAIDEAAKKLRIEDTYWRHDYIAR